jgi:hypothetical protein
MIARLLVLTRIARLHDRQRVGIDQVLRLSRQRQVQAHEV